jgi:DNA processing protein
MSGQLLKLADAVSLEPFAGRAEADELLARVTLSVITEPGDKFAGWLLERYKAAEVVTVLKNDFNFAELISGQDRIELQESFGDLSQLFRDARQRWQPRFSQKAVELALAAAARLGARVIVPTGALWPESLSDLHSGAPHCLWLRGDARVLKLADRSLAIVGSRLASSYGEVVTQEIVSAAVAENLAIVSGGAYGIDAIAHRATLALEGFTIAVLAGGIDRLYPAGNHELLTEIAASNALISEQAPGSSPTKWRFLQRNRLIAALGSATVVVEAGIRSGALNTVNHAKLLERPIGVVPGRIDSPQSTGCHELLRSSAGQVDAVQLIASPSQAVALALGESFSTAATAVKDLSALEKRVLDALGVRALNEMQIATKAGLTALELQQGLGGLELRGLILRAAKGWVKVD